MFTDKKSHRYEGFNQRLNLLGIAFILAGCILSARLWELQVVRWSEFRQQADSNRLRIQRVESPRGMIIGRDGHEDVVLADNRAARDLMFTLAECDIEPEYVARRLETLAGVDGAALLDEIESVRKANKPHSQIVVKKDVPRGVLARVEEYSYALPGVFTVVRPQRRYLYGSTAGQIMGYLNEINREELAARRDRYSMGDLIGRRGLEEMYEELLHGRDGQMLVTQYARGRPQIRTDAYGRPYVEVDEFGHRLKLERARIDPVPGQSVRITLDIGLQAKAEELLEGEEGAIAVLNARTGEVLALASSPSYDPSVFVDRGMSRSVRSGVIQDIFTARPNKMINRAFQEVYAPGSVYKILLAAAALEEGIINERTTYYCPGRFRLTPGGRPWHCWRRTGHGNVNVIDALAFSCDVFFYNVGLELGIDRIHGWSIKAGLGVKSGIDLPGEVEGLMPSPAWKEALLKPKHPDEPWEYRWYDGDTVNVSIGQGAMSTTPLQNAIMMATVTNGGYHVQPYLNRGLGPKPATRIWTDETLRIIELGLRKCVEKGPPAPTGTGREAAVPGMAVLGKTGTAQVMNLSHIAQYTNDEDIPKHMRHHAWFVAGVLDRDPPIAMCILVEHGHQGSRVAAPLARHLIEFFYGRMESNGITVARDGGDRP